MPVLVTIMPHTHAMHLSQASSASASASPFAPLPGGSPKKQRLLCVKVRNFAYPPSDECYLGVGPHTPKPKCVQVLNRFHRSWTVSGVSRLSIRSLDRADFDNEGGDTDTDDTDEEGEGNTDGWNGFKQAAVDVGHGRRRAGGVRR